jgi:uncharacterized protein
MNRTQNYVKQTRIAAPAEAVFVWHAAPGALERLMPPWESTRILERSGGVTDGRVVLDVRTGPIRQRWVAEHGPLTDGLGFRDVQVEGPFHRFEHTHRMIPEGSDASILEDRIHYEVPLGTAGALVGGRFVKQKLESLFTYRQRITREDLAAHQRFLDRGPHTVLVSGATGLVGTALTHFLTTGGHTVVPLVRQAGRTHAAREVVWDPQARKLDPAHLQGIDAVVHLAGENIAGARWNDAQKARIRDSRVHGTRLLAETLAGMGQPPKVLVSASAVGIYGNRPDETLTETADPGLGFLPDVCRAWETATHPAEARGIRVVPLRLGLVLSSQGGALARMLPAFKLGLGGRMGTGEQFMSWVDLQDVVGIIHHALFTDDLAGPVNATAPAPVTNREFARILGRVLGRPAWLPVPATSIRLLLGEMADALLLEGCRVLPARLEQSGYPFRFTDLEEALRFQLGRFGR